MSQIKISGDKLRNFIMGRENKTRPLLINAAAQHLSAAQCFQVFNGYLTYTDLYN